MQARACRENELFLESPEGRTENSPGLEPWERYAKEIALKGRPIL
jgi:hypothetical protein